MARARAYQVDELLKLRRLCKVSSDVLRRINSEAGIKEHVLRACSNSSDPFPFRSRQRSSSIITNPYDGYEVPPADDFVPFKAKANGLPMQPVKISPSPSIKRGKAERLLKEHGSPPGIRVTAGGRIVPDGLTPITSPRANNRQTFQSHQLAHISIPRVDLHNLPSLSYLHSVEGHLVLGDNQIFQVLNGHLVPVGRIGNPTLNLVCPPSNLHVASGGKYEAGVEYQIPMCQMASSFYPPNPEHEAIDEHTLSKLDECHSKFQEELRDLDRNEVLQRDSLTPAGKREIVRRRVELVNRIDETRRSILRARKILKERAAAANADNAPIVNNSQAPPVAAAPQTAAPVSQQYLNPSAPMGYGIMPGYPYAGSEFSPFAMMPPLPPPPSMPPHPFSYGIATIPSPVHAPAEFAPFPLQHDYPQSASLQSRAGNAGLGISNSFGPVEENNAPKSINLDGSGHQPRRSHAVAIRPPEAGLKDKKMVLNPASRSYQPRDANRERLREGEAAIDAGHASNPHFMPSAAMVAGVDRLVGSPPRPTHASLDKSDSTSKFGASSSTASTSDFFPQNTTDYSATKYAYKGHNPSGNLGGWMVDENDTVAQTTPKRTTSKQIWNSSPGEHFFDALPDDDGRPQTAFAATSPFRVAQDTRLPSSPRERSADQDGSNFNPSPGRSHRLNVSGRGHSHEATIISGDTPGALMIGISGAGSGPGPGPRASSMHRSDSGTGTTTSPGSRLYRLGLEDGRGNKLDRVHTEFEYLQGLREGLQQRTKHANEDAISAIVSQDSGLRRSSIPSFNSPAPPVNSPLSTPKSASSLDGKFSPATALAFSSQPNVKVVDMQRGIGMSSSPARPRGSDHHTSPLADRQRSPFLDAGRHLSAAESFSARMYRLQVQEKQRSAESSACAQGQAAARARVSVVAPQEHVQVVFPQQDGPMENRETRLQVQRNTHVPRTSPSPGMALQQTGRMSPSKRLSSAAATVLAFGRKLTSPEPGAEGPKSPTGNKPSSPSKGRPGWRRRIEDKIIPNSAPFSPPK